MSERTEQPRQRNRVVTIDDLAERHRVLEAERSEATRTVVELRARLHLLFLSCPFAYRNCYFEQFAKSMFNAGKVAKHVGLP